MATIQKKAFELVRNAGVLRSRDLQAHGIPRSALQRLHQQGQLRRIARGLYEISSSDPTEHIRDLCGRQGEFGRLN